MKRRRQAALAILIFVAVWPVVTLLLQARWSADPWKLMSFGMYAAPARRLEDLQLALSVEKDGVWKPVDEATVADEAARFIYWRRTLGALASVERLRSAMLAATQASKARVEVRMIRLDATTARVVFDREVLER